MLPARHRMRRPVEFGTAVRRGRRAGRRTVVVHLNVPPAPAPEEPARVGFVVSRAVGKAVTRNLVRRRLRHLMREHLDEVPPGSLLVVRALPAAAEATAADLDRDLTSAISAALRRRNAAPAGRARSASGREGAQ